MQVSDATVAVCGLGLMGGSFALALRGKCRALVGVARDANTRKQAVEAGVVDRAYADLSRAAAEADIVVLATPVRHIIEAVPIAAAAMQPGALLLDLASTKREVVTAMNATPEGVFAVGGHPMCGKETGGLDSADANLFAGTRFVITPTERSNDEALALVMSLSQALGARPIIMGAKIHDRAVAVVSHLPYLLAAALMHTEEQEAKQTRGVRSLAAGGFRDTTRLAASSVEMMLDILTTNRDEIEHALDLFERNIVEMRGLLADPKGLELWMAQARDARKVVFP
jgi:prephenate dehydrogenase